jgi:hypothetical protein
VLAHHFKIDEREYMKLQIVYTMLILSSFAAAQCSPTGSGTSCMGPVTISPPSGNTTQSSIIFVDLGLPAQQPAASSYILSIVNGTIQESDNNGAYHTLVGPQGLQGEPGMQGIQGVQGVQGVPGPAGPAGQNGQGFAIGTVITGTLVCPKSKGSVTAGFTTKGCTFTITGLSQ